MKSYLIKIFFTSFYFGLNISNAQTFEWAKSFGGVSNDIGRSITLDTLGNIYISGYFESTVDFDPGPGTFYLTSAGGWDAYIQKMDASGNFIWAKSFGSTGIYDIVMHHALDVDGNIYSTGKFDGTVDFDPGVGSFNLTSAGVRDIFISKLDANGNFIWASSFGGPSNDDGFSIAVDEFNHIYTSGLFKGTVDFDPTAGIYNLSSAGDIDVFILKMDLDGNFLWAKSFGGTSYDYMHSLAVDESGNVYTTGYFDGTSDFDPGSGTFNITSVGEEDVFIQKMDAYGNFVWAKSFGGVLKDRGNSIAIDYLGNIFIKGSFEGTVDFDCGTGIHNITAIGSFDTFVEKLDTNGNFLWAKTFAKFFGSTIEEGSNIGLVIDALGNTYITDYFEGTVDFDPGNGIFNLTSSGNTDIYIHKMDNNGNFLWATALGGSSYDTGYQITLDDSSNIFTTGFFDGTADFFPGIGNFNLVSSGGIDAYILKLSQPITTINEFLVINSLVAYPIPTSDIVNISFGDVVNHASFTVRDVLGNVISTQENYKLSVAKLELIGAKGLYFIDINADGIHRTLKVVKN